MKLNSVKTGALAVTLICGLAACSQGNVTPTTQAGPAATPQRQLQSVDSGPSLETFQQIGTLLPSSISIADAEKMLIKIDPNSINAAPKYSVKWFSSLGYGWPYGISRLSALSYLRYGSYYYPYSLTGSYYTPYSNGGYSPFLYSSTGYGGLYSGLGSGLYGSLSSLYSPYYWNYGLGGLGLYGSGFFGGFGGYGGYGSYGYGGYSSGYNNNDHDRDDNVSSTSYGHHRRY
jgi:hypothetical protein